MFSLKKKPLTEDAQHIINIVEEYSNKKDIDSENEISICIGDEHVTLSNHVFLYKKVFNLDFTDKLKKTVKENIEEEMQLLKESLFNNETNLLSSVLKLAHKKENIKKAS